MAAWLAGLMAPVQQLRAVSSRVAALNGTAHDFTGYYKAGLVHSPKHLAMLLVHLAQSQPSHGPLRVVLDNAQADAEGASHTTTPPISSATEGATDWVDAADDSGRTTAAVPPSTRSLGRQASTSTAGGLPPSTSRRRLDSLAWSANTQSHARGRGVAGGLGRREGV